MAGLFTISQGLYTQPAPMLAVDGPHRQVVSANSSALANAQTTVISAASGDGLKFGVNDALLLEALIATFQGVTPGVGLSSAGVLLTIGGGGGALVPVAQSITTGLNIPISTQLVVILQPYAPLVLGADMSVWGGGLNYPITLQNITLAASLLNNSAADITVSSKFMVRFRKANGIQDG
jgi:hypothetical protein